MSELFPCPFCNGTNTQIRTNTYWTGMSSKILSVEVVHWCERQEGQLQSFLQLKGKTEQDAVDKWNRRVK